MTIRHDDELSTWGKVKRWSKNNPRLSRPIWFALVLAVIAGIVWALTPDPQMGFRTAIPGRGPGMQVAQPVVVATAERGDINVTVNALGTVTPLATAQVRPQASGMLLRINFEEGQMVRAGQVLAEIDPRPYQATLAQVEAVLARDQANLANSRTDLARYEELVKQNAISQQQLAATRATVAAQAATVQSDQANVQNARINLGYTRVVSPVNGRVGLRLVDVGNIVSSSNTLVVVTQLDPMSVLFTVPEDNVAPINQQIGAGATLVVDAYDRSQTTKITSGTLATVDNVIDVSTGSVKLRAMFDNKDGKLFPNQFVNVRLVVNTLHDQTLIPLPAVQRGSDGTYVFIVNPDKTVSTRTVKLGVQEGEKVAVTEGLAPGDTVVVQGADRLRDGAQVTIPERTAAIAPPSAGAAAGPASRGRGLSPAAIARVTAACGDDIKEYCSTEEQLNARGPGGGNRGGAAGGAGGGQRGPGGGAFAANPQMRVVGCLMRNRSELSRQCTSAMPQGGRRGGGGGGFGGVR